VEKIGLPPEQYTVAFQSRFGFNKWLEPATVDVLKTSHLVE
jgi:protoheme ferro-lyase